MVETMSRIMTIIHLLIYIILQLMFVNVTGEMFEINHNSTETTLQEKPVKRSRRSIYHEMPIQLNLQVEFTSGESISLKWIKTKHYLANENLPVVLLGDHYNQNIDIGEFVVYHDINQCSAVIYYDKEFYLTGSIGLYYTLENLPYLFADDGNYQGPDPNEFITRRERDDHVFPNDMGGLLDEWEAQPDLMLDQLVDQLDDNSEILIKSEPGLSAKRHRTELLDQSEAESDPTIDQLMEQIYENSKLLFKSEPGLSAKRYRTESLDQSDAQSDLTLDQLEEQLYGNSEIPFKSDPGPSAKRHRTELLDQSDAQADLTLDQLEEQLYGNSEIPFKSDPGPSAKRHRTELLDQSDAQPDLTLDQLEEQLYGNSEIPFKSDPGPSAKRHRTELLDQSDAQADLTLDQLEEQLYGNSEIPFKSDPGPSAKRHRTELLDQSDAQADLTLDQLEEQLYGNSEIPFESEPGPSANRHRTELLDQLDAQPDLTLSQLLDQLDDNSETPFESEPDPSAIRHRTRRNFEGTMMNTNISNVAKVRSRRDHRMLDFHYLEILVIVTRDITYKIKEQYGADYYLEVIVKKYVNYFNSVDMMFKKLQGVFVKLHINLAKIVIESDQNRFEFVNDHLLSYSDTILGLREYLIVHSNIYTPDSFDHVFMFTSLPIENDQEIVLGMTDRSKNLYKARKNGIWYFGVPITLIRDTDNYALAVHEISLTFNFIIESWDRGFGPEGQCYSVMQKGSSKCQNCLQWTEDNLIQFGEFFKYNRNRCFLLNSPRSLQLKRAKFLTPTKQCKCFGYHSYMKKRISNNKKIVKNNVGASGCNTRLKCQKTGKNPKVFVTTLEPFDGTICIPQHRVCWSGKCQPIVKPIAAKFLINFPGTAEDPDDIITSINP